MAIYLEELENLRPVRFGNSRYLEQFATTLHITIINLKGNGSLGDGSLYLRLQKKLPDDTISKMDYEKRRQPSIERLREWIIMVSEHQTMAHKTVYGFQEKNQRSGWRRYHANTDLEYCRICGKKHRVWQCDIFEIMSKQQRWETVKTHEFCFCCLEEGHKVIECS